MNYNIGRENDYIKQTARRRNTLDGIFNAAVKDVNRACNFTISGKKNNAPFFSKRGHVAESTAGFSLLANCCASGVDMSKVGIATDEWSFNIDPVKRNDIYKDIVVKNVADNVEQYYQAKVCSTADKSMKAATKEKYINAGSRPYVPKDQSDTFGNIQINVDGEVIKSDDYTLEDLNNITSNYCDGKVVNPFKDNKTQILYDKVIAKGVSDSAKSAFFCSGIKEVTDYLCGKEFNSENGFASLSHMVTSVIDGCVRSYIRLDTGFKSYGDLNSVALAEMGYDVAKELANFALGKKTGKEVIESGCAAIGGDVGAMAASSLMSHLGVSMGSPFGAIGSIVGCTLGQAAGKYLGGCITGGSDKSLNEIGVSIARQNSYASSYGGFQDVLQVGSECLIGAAMPLVQGAQMVVNALVKIMEGPQKLVDSYVTYRETKKLNKAVNKIEKNINETVYVVLNEYKNLGSETLYCAVTEAINNSYQENIVGFKNAVMLHINELVSIQEEFEVLNISDKSRKEYTNDFLEYIKQVDTVSFNQLDDLIRNYDSSSIELYEFISLRKIRSLIEKGEKDYE